MAPARKKGGSPSKKATERPAPAEEVIEPTDEATATKTNVDKDSETLLKSILGLSAKLASAAATIAQCADGALQLDLLETGVEEVVATAAKLREESKLAIEKRNREETIDETSIIKRRRLMKAELDAIAARGVSEDVVKDIDIVSEGKAAKRKGKKSSDVEQPEFSEYESSIAKILVERATNADLEKGTAMEGESLVGVVRQISRAIDKRRGQINESNKEEFLSPKDPLNTCARTDAIELNRSLQMRKHKANNQLTLQKHQEQLAKDMKRNKRKNRAITQDSGENNDENNKDADEHQSLKGIYVPTSFEDRVTNIEEHLNIHISAEAGRVSLFERVKVLEDRIMNIEDNYPAFAAFYFNQKLDATADSRGSAKPSGPAFVMPSDALGRPPQTVVYINGKGELNVDLIPDTQVAERPQENVLTEALRNHIAALEAQQEREQEDKRLEKELLEAIQQTPMTEDAQLFRTGTKSKSKNAKSNIDEDKTVNYSEYEILEMKIQMLKQKLLAKAIEPAKN